MTDSAIHARVQLGFPWKTFDPFLFCAYHDDTYPQGNERMGPAESLAGRNIGMDFAGKDGWRMYHGEVVPGFPRHPHRGFETITVVRQGFVDHADSLGATARFGPGDVQWMTAGQGIVHSEMFPLREREDTNPLELFQVWLNLPRASKMVEPHFSMLWRDTIPQLSVQGGEGSTQVRVIAGALEGATPPAPPPKSWASDPRSDVAVWTLSMQAGARWTLPAGPAGVNRTLYLHRGSSLLVDGEPVSVPQALRLNPERTVELVAAEAPAELLMLQGRPIGEPTVHYGPFVMNTPREIEQAITDYRRTQYGGWPWKSDGPVHAREDERFAVHADGRREVAEVAEES